ncbi:MAG: ATP-binding protein [Actinomycetota bacterium]|nr:ATP-binding protein [Actinomycetota bacterium]
MTLTAIVFSLGAGCAGAGLGWLLRGRLGSGRPPAVTRLVVDLFPLGALVVDSSDDVVMSNRAAREMGLLRGDRLAVSGLRQLAALTRSDGEPREAEVSLLRGRLAREPVAVLARSASAGAPGQVALVVEDITESRRVEAVRHDFVANVSHELKTPIGALSLLSEAVGDAADSPPDVRRFAGRMRHESNRLAQLVQELIELSRLQGGEALPASAVVVLDSVVAEAVDATALTAHNCGITVATSEVVAGVSVLGIRSQLVTAVANLLDNAIRYSPAGSQVDLSVRPAEEQVVIAIRDRGIGIAPDDLERVFERFYRADAARSRETGGTGLGLAIVKHVATNHGGSVEVSSIDGAGSTFTLRLPALDAAAVRRARRPVSPSQGVRR